MKNEDQPIESSAEAETDRLVRDASWALENGLPARDLVPMLNKLMQRAEPGSLPWRFACQELAEQLVEADPWRAALIVRRLLADGESDRAWAVLGLCLALLGHARSSLSAYRRALALAPHCAEYAHNVGHLLDAGLNRPKDALRYLNQAHRSLPSDVEIAASLAQALVRLGREAEARALLAPRLSVPEVEELLARWT